MPPGLRLPCPFACYTVLLRVAFAPHATLRGCRSPCGSLCAVADFTARLRCLRWLRGLLHAGLLCATPAHYTPLRRLVYGYVVHTCGYHVYALHTHTLLRGCSSALLHVCLPRLPHLVAILRRGYHTAHYSCTRWVVTVVTPFCLYVPRLGYTFSYTGTFTTHGSFAGSLRRTHGCTPHYCTVLRFCTRTRFACRVGYFTHFAFAVYGLRHGSRDATALRFTVPRYYVPRLRLVTVRYALHGLLRIHRCVTRFVYTRHNACPCTDFPRFCAITTIHCGCGCRVAVLRFAPRFCWLPLGYLLDLPFGSPGGCYCTHALLVPRLVARCLHALLRIFLHFTVHAAVAFYRFSPTCARAVAVYTCGYGYTCALPL